MPLVKQKQRKLDESKDFTYQETRQLQSSEMPYIMCRMLLKPSVTKRLVTSVITCLGLLIRLPFWMVYLSLGIIAHYAKCLLMWLGITQKLDRLYLNRLKKSWYK